MRGTKFAIKALGVASIGVGLSTLTLTYGIQNGAISVYEKGAGAAGSTISVCVGDSGCTGGSTPGNNTGGGAPPSGNNPTGPSTPAAITRPDLSPDNPENSSAVPNPLEPLPSIPNRTTGEQINNSGGGGFNDSGLQPPEWLVALLSPLRGIIERSVLAIRSVPPAIAIAFPYILFILLLLLMIRFLWQATREAIAAHRFYELLRRQQLISEEKDTFIALSSHYLLTPLTVMRSGIDTMVSLREASQEQLQPMITALDDLKNSISKVLKDVENDTALKGIPPPSKELKTDITLGSPYFVLPVLSVGLVVLCANLLLGIVGEIDLNTINLLIQTAAFALIAVLFYSSVRTRHLRDAEFRRAKQLVEYEEAIDTARNKFIIDATEVLSIGLTRVKNTKHTVPTTPSLRFFDEGHRRFADILAKFQLLSSIQTGITNKTDHFDLREAIEESLDRFKAQITEKKLTVRNETGDLEVLQNRLLFGFVLASVLDNAVKFSREGGEIVIAADRTMGTIKVNVSDNGVGMPAEKLPHLFKPFSRVGSALQFDYEGLGFSLFLDKIIMDYTGGNIKATSRLKKGTVVSLTT